MQLLHIYALNSYDMHRYLMSKIMFYDAYYDHLFVWLISQMRKIRDVNKWLMKKLRNVQQIWSTFFGNTCTTKKYAVVYSYSLHTLTLLTETFPTLLLHPPLAGGSLDGCHLLSRVLTTLMLPFWNVLDKSDTYYYFFFLCIILVMLWFSLCVYKVCW